MNKSVRLFLIGFCIMAIISLIGGYAIYTNTNPKAELEPVVQEKLIFENGVTADDYDPSK
ncbi:hypothetical protein [Guggenheimella bovis]